MPMSYLGSLVDPGIGWGRLSPVTDDKHIVVLGDSPHDLLVVDVSNPAAMVVTGRIVGAGVNNESRRPIPSSQQYLYYSDNLSIITVEFLNRAAPAVVATQSLPADRVQQVAQLESPSRAYLQTRQLTSPFTTFFDIFDTTVLGAWTLIGRAQLTGFGSGSLGMAIRRDSTTVVAARTSSEDFFAIDIDPETAPSLIGGSLIAGSGFGVLDAELAGNVLYTQGGTPRRLKVRDVSSVAPPTSLADVSNAYAGSIRFAADGYLYSTGNQSLQRWDVSNPAAPVIVETLNHPQLGVGSVVIDDEAGVLYTTSSPSLGPDSLFAFGIVPRGGWRVGSINLG